MVMVLEDHVAVTVGGRPEGIPMPVAPVVVCVISGQAVLIHGDGVMDAAPATLFGVTVIVPVAFTALPQPPVNGML